MHRQQAVSVIERAWKSFARRYDKLCRIKRHGVVRDVYVSRDGERRIEVQKTKQQWSIQKIYWWNTAIEQEYVGESLCRFKNKYDAIIEDITNIPDDEQIITRTIRYNRHGDVCCIINQEESRDCECNSLECIYLKHNEIVKTIVQDNPCDFCEYE